MNNRVLIIINNLNLGGAEKVAIDQANALVEKGYEVTLLTLIRNSDNNFSDSLSKSVKRIEWKKTKLNFFSFIRMVRFLNKNEFNEIITHLYLSNTLLRLAYIFSFSKAILLTYEHNIYDEKSRKAILLDRFLSKWSTKIIAVSEPVKIFLINCGIDQNKIIVIHNAIKPLTKKQIDKMNFGLKEDDFLITSVGNVSPQKGYDLVIEAAAIVHTYKNIFFFICGDDKTDYAETLKIKAKEMGVEKNVFFLGSRKDVAEILSCSDIFLMASRWEGMSISLLEALSLSKLVLASDIDSIKNIITNGYDGILFESEDSKRLAEKIIDVYCNKENYINYKLNGKKHLKNILLSQI